MFQIVTKSANNHCFLKNMFPLQTLTNKTPVCKKNLRRPSGDKKILDTLDNINNVLFGSDFKVLLYLLSQFRKTLKFSVYNS